jgi:hypothetical protein
VRAQRDSDAKGGVGIPRERCGWELHLFATEQSAWLHAQGSGSPAHEGFTYLEAPRLGDAPAHAAGLRGSTTQAQTRLTRGAHRVYGCGKALWATVRGHRQSGSQAIEAQEARDEEGSQNHASPLDPSHLGGRSERMIPSVEGAQSMLVEGAHSLCMCRHQRVVRIDEERIYRPTDRYVCKARLMRKRKKRSCRRSNGDMKLETYNASRCVR